MPKPPELDLSVIVVNYNTAHLLREMFDTLAAATQGISHEVIVVDNASRDDSLSVLRSQHPGAHVIANAQNVGFGRANNQAIEHLRGRHVLLLNTDAFMAPDALQRSLAHLAANPKVGVLGVKLLSRDGSLQPSCRYFPTPLNIFLLRTGLTRFLPFVRQIDDLTWDHAGARDCDWVPGCFYLMPREVVTSTGLFDPRFFLYYEEVDHCRRAKQAGWGVRYLGDTSTVHIGGESAKSDSELTAQGRQISVLLTESELLYVRKHHGLAGLGCHLALSLLGDAYIALKRLIKHQRLSVAAAEFDNSRQIFRFCKLTQAGTKATR
jgi:N-acetylglucosaminyl-diphospho-decaprenol L-rhamnosyltransferase